MNRVLVTGQWLRRMAVGGFLFLAGAVHAAVPPCLENGNPSALPVNNGQVLEFKQKGKNQFQARAHVQGRLVRITQVRKTHQQFEIQIGPRPQDTLEVVYNVAFGDLPSLTPNLQVEACGDYITTRQSPSGAIIHWVHWNPGDRDGGKHEHGYVMLDGVVYGQEYNRPHGISPLDLTADYLNPDFLSDFFRN